MWATAGLARSAPTGRLYRSAESTTGYHRNRFMVCKRSSGAFGGLTATSLSGSFRRDTKMRGAKPKHRMCSTPEYRAWAGAIERCKRHENYAGRGITVCAEWRNSFEAFYAHVGPRPSPAHSLDRFPDNDGNYEPGNVRWATRTQQNRNRRVCTGLMELSEKTGVSVHALRMRSRRGTSLLAVRGLKCECGKCYTCYQRRYRRGYRAAQKEKSNGCS